MVQYRTIVTMTD